MLGCRGLSIGVSSTGIVVNRQIIQESRSKDRDYNYMLL